MQVEEFRPWGSDSCNRVSGKPGAVQRSSLLLDLHILLKTARAVVMLEGN